MTILEALTEAHTSTGIATDLVFAELQEFNSFIDSFKHPHYPINVVVPVTLDGTFTNNRAQESILVQGWILTRLSQDTNNYRSKAIEDTYINPMRILARRFLLNLIDSDISDAQVEDVSYSITPEYKFLSVHVFGVSYNSRIPIISNICR